MLKQNPIRQILKLFGLFLLFYALSLPLWLGMKDLYQELTAPMMFNLAGWVYDLQVSPPQMHEGILLFSVKNKYVLIDQHFKDIGFIFDVQLQVDAITFNVPMTLALMLALVFGYNKREEIKRADLVTNGLLALLLLHLVTFFIVSVSLIFSTVELAENVSYYFKDSFMPREFVVNLGSLLSTYAARFEPFLIALYVWYQLKSAPKAEEVPEEATVSG